VQLLRALAAGRRGDPAATPLALDALELGARLGHPGLPLIVERQAATSLLALVAATGHPLATMTFPVTVSLLGGFTVTRGGRAVDVPPGQGRQPVKLVATAGGRLTAESAMEALWPEADPDASANRLRTVLNRLKDAAGDLVLRDDRQLRLGPAVHTDLQAFTDDARRATLLAAGGSREAVSAARSALARYGGDLLPGDPYEHWAELPRQRLRNQALGLLDLCAGWAARAEDLDEAVRCLERAIDLAPDEEERYLSAARHLLTQGRRGAARRLVARARSVVEDLRVRPPAAQAQGRVQRQRPAAGQGRGRDLPGGGRAHRQRVTGRGRRDHRTFSQFKISSLNERWLRAAAPRGTFTPGLPSGAAPFGLRSTCCPHRRVGFPPGGDSAVTLFAVAGSVRPDMIETVRHHINDALARTSDSSTLSEDAQDAELAQASAEGCDLLTQWLGSFEWEQLRPAGSAPISDAIPEWERIRPFLDPLVEAMARFSQRQNKTREERNSPDPAAHIDEVLRAASRTARRYKRYDRGQLFVEAGQRTQDLRDEVCGLAAEFKAEQAANFTAKKKEAETEKESKEAEAKKADRRRRVRKVLGTIVTLLTVSLALASASPHDMQQNIPQWGHEAVKVLMVYDIAHTAQPGVQVTPPRLGPRVR
jgi:DNA-binding SARP family transcriptional activator